MRFFLPTLVLATLGLLLLPKIPSAAAQEPDSDIFLEESEQDPVAELRDAQRQMHLAHLRMASLLADHNLGMLSAQAEVETSRIELQMFLEFDAELETANSQLELDYAKDSLADSIEELEQLSLMYERNALASGTAQIVVDRAARAIERQKIATAIQEKSLYAWRTFGLANRQKELGHAALLAQASLEATISSQELELAELEMEIAELQDSIKELKAEVASESEADDAAGSKD